MTPQESMHDNAEALRGMVGRVRRRWRVRHGVESLALALATVIVLALVAALLREIGAWTEPPAWARWIAFAMLFAVPAARLARITRRGPDDRRVALYIEEREAGLDEALVSAVEQLDGPVEDASPVLAARVVERARGALETREQGDGVERPLLRRAALGALGLGIVVVLLATVGPLALRDAARGMVTPWKGAPPPPVLALAVSPGNVEVPRGGAVEIQAAGRGFVPGTAELVTRPDSGSEWQRLPMGRDTAPDGAFTARLFDLMQPATYYVEADGVRSPSFRITVVDLPTVGKLVLEVRPPAYTGLPAERHDPGGDVAALVGSTVVVRATSTRPVTGATIVVDGKTRIPMERREGGGGDLVAALRVRADGFYHVELETGDGRRVRGTLSYAIDALLDLPPTVRVSAPGRDIHPTAVEEVTTESEAHDDYGLRRLELRYSVNGGPEQSVVLADSLARTLPELSATHTFFLEELSLKAGDAVAYHARATDGLGQVGTSDVYFLQIRRFDRAYRQSESGGGGGGGGGGGAGQGLSQRQREIVVGTFNVVRDSARGPLDDWREGVATLGIGETRLREEVTVLVERLNSRRLVSADSQFIVVRDQLDSAAAAMRQTEAELGRQRPREALPAAQRALAHLLRAEAAYREIQVSFGGGGGGGGGGGEDRRAEELADLFELETDRLRNQYETVRRDAEEQTERELDEVVERLRRLASRQQQENERMQRMADALGQRGGSAAAGGGGGGGGGSQRQLAEQAEEEARRLERLARERSSPALAESARQLRAAAEAMRRAASGNPQSGGTSGSSALDRLRSAARELETSRSANAREEIEQLLGRVERLRERQREAGEQAVGLAGGGANPAQIEELGTRGTALAGDAERLEADLDRLSRSARRDQPRASAKLDDAVRGMREGRARDRMLASQDLIRRGTPGDLVRLFEERTGRILDTTASRIREAVGALGAPRGDRAQRALEQARELVRGLESLRERARESGSQGAREPGSQGQAQGQGQGQGQGQRGEAREGGQPGEGGQGGRNPGGSARTMGGGLGAGNDRVSESTASGGVGAATGERLRQFTRELRIRRQAAESLRREVLSLGQDVRELDRALDELRTLERNGARSLGEPQGLARLEEELIARLKEFEFSLWRALDPAAGAGPALGAGARVPPEYRELVEEYYRSLARQRSTTAPRSGTPRAP
ncbi:MAG: DUF4175 family protein [Gemmatimonadales bacterium]